MRENNSFRDQAELEPILGHTFADRTLLETALTHSSYANEHGTMDYNERLEFLGDAVLGFLTAEHLFVQTHRSEGELTKLRAALVCEKALASYAVAIDLGSFLRLGHGERHNGGASRPSILADAFEAVLAALYLDGGVAAVKPFLLPFIDKECENLQRPQFRDFKTQLQEIVQQNPGERLEYVLVSENGPDHSKTFVTEVHLNSNVIGTGRAHSKKEAEQLAAREALKLMGYDDI